MSDRCRSRGSAAGKNGRASTRAGSGRSTIGRRRRLISVMVGGHPSRLAERPERDASASAARSSTEASQKDSVDLAPWFAFTRSQRRPSRQPPVAASGNRLTQIIRPHEPVRRPAATWRASAGCAWPATLRGRRQRRPRRFQGLLVEERPLAAAPPETIRADRAEMTSRCGLELRTATPAPPARPLASRRGRPGARQPPAPAPAAHCRRRECPQTKSSPGTDCRAGGRAGARQAPRARRRISGSSGRLSR